MKTILEQCPVSREPPVQESSKITQLFAQLLQKVGKTSARLPLKHKGKQTEAERIQEEVTNKIEKRKKK